MSRLSDTGAGALTAWRSRWCPPDFSGKVGVAYSAGADSTALLAAAVSVWPGQVVALHVHHGLQAAADGFEATAREVASRLNVPLQVGRTDARHAPGQSPEDAARQARYLALAGMAREADVSVVLLGQHADDQAETLLLALSRGAGLPGLAGMPERFVRHGALFGRPFLGIPAATLRDWVLEQGLAFVDDPSNTDPRFTRNRIRSLLMPAWQACFPGFRQALARSARHAAQAQVLLDELAHEDLQTVGVPPMLSALQALSRARQSNVLRHWLKQEAGAAPTEAQLSELLDQVDACRTRGHRLQLRAAGGRVERADDHLVYRTL